MGEGFFRQTKLIFRRRTGCTSRKISKVWWEKTRPGGIHAYEDRFLYRHIICECLTAAFSGILIITRRESAGPGRVSRARGHKPAEKPLAVFRDYISRR